jgi:hypothetical protein
MKPRSDQSIEKIEKFVSLGHIQGPANCRVLLDEIEALATAARAAGCAMPEGTPTKASSGYSISEIELFVSRGRSQNPANCRLLLQLIAALKEALRGRFKAA